MKRSFDNIARPYALLERGTLGGTLQRARCVQLEQLPHHGRLLILGEGDGRFLQVLTAARPHCEVDVVERSSEMLRLARRRNAHARGVRYFEMDARQFMDHGPYDAIITLFFLDCFEGEDLNHLVLSLSAQAAPSARWLYADFALARDGLVGQLHRLTVAALYRAFTLTTDIAARRLDDPIPHLEREGFTVVEQRQLSAGLLRSVLLSRSPPSPREA